MSLPPAEAVVLIGMPMALGLGLMYGLGPCLVSCLPFLGPVFLSTGGGMRRSWRVMLPVSLGRLTVYGGFGAISGWWGGRFVAGVEGWALHLAVGLAALLVGGAMLARRRSQAGCAARSPGNPVQPLRRIDKPEALAGQTMPFGLYLMGVGMALSPCAPQGVVLISAAASGSVIGGLGFGLSFGLGAVAGPALVYGVLVAYLGQQLREQLGRWLARMEWLATALMLAVGGGQAVKAVRLLLVL